MSDSSVLKIDTFTLTLFWPDSAPEITSLDRMELYDITLAHVQNKLRIELVGVNIERVTLDMQTALTTAENLSSSMAWTELISGSVKFDQPAPIPSSTLQTLVVEAFENEALDLYLIRLKLAAGESLQQIDRVSVGMDGIAAPTPSNNVISVIENDDVSPLLIIIVVCVVIGVIMACVFAYCLLYGRRRRTRQPKEPELPGITTDPTPPEEEAGEVEYSPEDYYHNGSQEFGDPYLLNAVDSSDAGSSLHVDSDTVVDLENQSVATTYSYLTEMPFSNQVQARQAPPPPVAAAAASREMTLQKLPRQQQVPTMAGSTGNSSPSRKAAGFLGGFVGKYMGAGASPDESDHGEDEYGFDKEASPSMDDGSVFIKVDDYDDNRSLVSDGRVGQILGDVNSIQGQESPHNFDDIWNDESDGEDNNTHKDEDIQQFLNVSHSSSSIPFDERVRSTESRPFDEKRIEQRDIVITPSTAALVDDIMQTATLSNVLDKSRKSAMQDNSADDISQIVDDEFADEESVQDYDHHQPVVDYGHHQPPQEDELTQDGSYTEEASLAEDSYGFVYQKHYHAKKDPLIMPAPTEASDDNNINLTLPQNLKQRTVVDFIPGGVMLEAGDDDESVEVVSVTSKTSANSKTSTKSKTSIKSGLSSSIKSLTEKPRKVVKGMSVRKKRTSDWGEGPTTTVSSPVPVSPENSRPTSPSPSVGSSDSAKFRALMSEPDVYTEVPTPERKPKPAADEGQKQPASLLQPNSSDSDDDCYMDEDEPFVSYPSSLLTFDEKKEDSSVNSVEFSIDA
jgi:hypothetical protein